MKILMTLIACMMSIYAADPPKVKPLKIGASAPAFSLVGVDNKIHSLSDFEKFKYLVMIFTCNHCPDARAAWKRINNFAKKYAAKGVQVVAVSTNSPKALVPWENGYSVYGDSFPEMKQVSAEREFVFPYLYDGDTQEVGLTYGAMATPHVFLFGPERELLYEGHFDNGHRDSGPASKNTVRDNVDALLAGKPVIDTQENVFGCSTKWAYKEEWAIKKQNEWDALPIKVDEITPKKMKSLIANGTGKVRVVHFWVTNNKENEANFPTLIDTYRRYHRRRFDMVTIGSDLKNNKEAVLNLLKKKHLPTSPSTLKLLKKEGRDNNHFFMKADDPSAVTKLLNKKPKAYLPATIVIAPKGEILYKKLGEINDVELRRAIVKGIEADQKLRSKKK